MRSCWRYRCTQGSDSRDGDGSKTFSRGLARSTQHQSNPCPTPPVRTGDCDRLSQLIFAGGDRLQGLCNRPEIRNVFGVHLIYQHRVEQHLSRCRSKRQLLSSPGHRAPPLLSGYLACRRKHNGTERSRMSDSFHVIDVRRNSVEVQGGIKNLWTTALDSMPTRDATSITQAELRKRPLTPSSVAP